MSFLYFREVVLNPERTFNYKSNDAQASPMEDSDSNGPGKGLVFQVSQVT